MKEFPMTSWGFRRPLTEEYLYSIRTFRWPVKLSETVVLGRALCTSFWVSTYSFDVRLRYSLVCAALCEGETPGLALDLLHGSEDELAHWTAPSLVSYVQGLRMFSHSFCLA